MIGEVPVRSGVYIFVFFLIVQTPSSHMCLETSSITTLMIRRKKRRRIRRNPKTIFSATYQLSEADWKNNPDSKIFEVYENIFWYKNTSVIRKNDTFRVNFFIIIPIFLILFSNSSFCRVENFFESKFSETWNPQELNCSPSDPDVFFVKMPRSLENNLCKNHTR